ncbi:choice-of-anchor P family protein [Spirillospora sp. NPDC127200]
MPARHIGAIVLLSAGLLTAALPAAPSSAASAKAKAYGVWAQGALSAGPLPRADSAFGPTTNKQGPWVLGQAHAQILSAEEFQVTAREGMATAQVKGIRALGRTVQVADLHASCTTTGTGIKTEVRIGNNHFGNHAVSQGVVPGPTRITFDGGSAVINEQQLNTATRALTVNALHITTPQRGDFILGSVTCSPPP